MQYFLLKHNYTECRDSNIVTCSPLSCVSSVYYSNLSILQFLSVVLCIAGIVLFAYADGFGLANIVGVALSVGSAIGAALYKVRGQMLPATSLTMSAF